MLPRHERGRSRGPHGFSQLHLVRSMTAAVHGGLWNASHGCRCHAEAQGEQTKAEGDHTQKMTDSQGFSPRNLEPQKATGNEKPLQDLGNGRKL